MIAAPPLLRPGVHGQLLPTESRSQRRSWARSLRNRARQRARNSTRRMSSGAAPSSGAVTPTGSLMTPAGSTGDAPPSSTKTRTQKLSQAQRRQRANFTRVRDQRCSVKELLASGGGGQCSTTHFNDRDLEKLKVNSPIFERRFEYHEELVENHRVANVRVCGCHPGEIIRLNHGLVVVTQMDPLHVQRVQVMSDDHCSVRNERTVWTLTKYN